MTNTKMLEQIISASGLKKQYIAAYLGMHYYTLHKKINNVTDFTSTEISKLCILLKITDLELKQKVFFADAVD